MAEAQKLTESFHFRGQRQDLRRLHHLSAEFILENSDVLRLALLALEELVRAAKEKGECPCHLRRRLERLRAKRSS